MLDSDVDSLLDVPIADLFVDDYSNGRLCNIVHHPSLAMVDFVRHAVQISASIVSGRCRIRGPLLNSAIRFDVHNVPNSTEMLDICRHSYETPVPVYSEVCAQIDHTTLLERA